MMHVFAQVLVLAAEAEPAAEESGGAALLLPAWEELIAGIIAFAIVFFFVWKWAIPALNKSLDARRAAIQGELNAAEAAKVEAESLLSDYQTQLATARDDAARVVEEARESGDQVKADIIARAETEAEQMKDRARDEISSERDRVAGDLRRHVADLSLGVAAKVVGETLDEDRQRDLIDRYIDDLGGVS